MREYVDTENTDVAQSTDTEDSSAFGNPIELTEGTLTTGEEVTLVGKASEAATSVDTDTDLSVAMPRQGAAGILENTSD